MRKFVLRLAGWATLGAAVPKVADGAGRREEGGFGFGFGCEDGGNVWQKWHRRERTLICCTAVPVRCKELTFVCPGGGGSKITCCHSDSLFERSDVSASPLLQFDVILLGFKLVAPPESGARRIAANASQQNNVARCRREGGGGAEGVCVGGRER